MNPLLPDENQKLREMNIGEQNSSVKIYTLIAYKSSGMPRTRSEDHWSSELELHNFDDLDKIAKQWADLLWINHNEKYESDYEFDILINGVSMYSSNMNDTCYTDEYGALDGSLEPVLVEIMKKRDEYLAHFRKVAEDKKLAEEAIQQKIAADSDRTKEAKERAEFERLPAKYGKAGMVDQKYKCPDCGWIGTEEEMVADYVYEVGDAYWETRICPNCRRYCLSEYKGDSE